MSIIKQPDEYINYYSERLKEELELYDLDVNYFGFIGFILNLLGWSRYDSINYYDYLFKEAFVATGDEDKNLHLHGSIFKFYPALAKAALANGNIEFDFNNIAKFDSNTMESRKIFLGDSENYAYFDINDFKFTIESQYIFYEDINSIKTIIMDPNEDISHIPSPTKKVSVPLKNTKQYNITSFDINLPYYPFNSYHQETISLNQPFVSDMKIFVTESHKTETEEYEYKFVKFLEDGDSNCVFIRHVSLDGITIEFGSGIYGKWLANAKITIDIYTTHGDEGNLNHKETYTPKINNQISMITYFKNGQTQRQPISAKNFNINFNYSSDGEAMKTGTALRNEIIRHIQSRNNLINTTDFENIYKRYYPVNDFKFVFRKTHPVDNTFYLFNVFRNEYMDVVKSSNTSVFRSDFNINVLNKPVFENNLISPFVYIYDDFFDMYNGFFQYSNQNVNFREFVIKTNDYIPPTLHLNIQYEFNNGHQTHIYLKSYQNISEEQFLITIEEYNIYDEQLIDVNENTKLLTIDDILTKQIEIKIENNNIKALTNRFTHTIDISDILSLFIFNDINESYICSIPVIDKTEYDKNQNLYLERIYNTLIGVDVSTNRMQTDNVQFRFLESNQIERFYTERILKANYDFDLQLPLKISIELYIKEKSARNVSNFNSIKDEILVLIANFLQKKATGTDIQIYNSQIIDLIHSDYDFIKSVQVSLTDSSGNLLNDGLENYDDKTIYQNILSTQDIWSNTIEFSQTKIKLLQYTPVFWYWDINNINIHFQYL